MSARKTVKPLVTRLLRRAGYQITRFNAAVEPFQSWQYQRHNARRLEHLATLGISVFDRSVLEVGAGVGDHTHYYLDRESRVTVTDARPENLAFLRRRYSGLDIRELNLDVSNPTFADRFDVVHCYGLLYHLNHPGEAIRFMADHCTSVLVLETCVSFGDGEQEHLVPEDETHSTQSFVGMGCRPTRDWVFAALRTNFEHVYCPTTQPNHPEFPLDWTRPELHLEPLSRAVFVASRSPLDRAVLIPQIPDVQVRHP